MGGIDREVERDYGVQLLHGHGTVLALHRRIGLIEQAADIPVVEVPVLGVNRLAPQQGVIDRLVAALSALDQRGVEVLTPLALRHQVGELALARRAVARGVAVASAVVPGRVEAVVLERHGAEPFVIDGEGGAAVGIELAGQRMTVPGVAHLARDGVARHHQGHGARHVAAPALGRDEGQPFSVVGSGQRRRAEAYGES